MPQPALVVGARDVLRRADALHDLAALAVERDNRQPVIRLEVLVDVAAHGLLGGARTLGGNGSGLRVGIVRSLAVSPAGLKSELPLKILLPLVNGREVERGG